MSVGANVASTGEKRLPNRLRRYPWKAAASLLASATSSNFAGSQAPLLDIKTQSLWLNIELKRDCLEFRPSKPPDVREQLIDQQYRTNIVNRDAKAK
jgi:hypothetical protein